MPRKPRGCCEEVKSACLNSTSCTHVLCNTTRRNTTVKGDILNEYLGCNGFLANSNYLICKNLRDKVMGPRVRSRKNKPQTVIPRDHTTRSKTKINSKFSAGKLKAVGVTVAGIEDVFPKINFDPESMSLDPPAGPRQKLFKEKVLSLAEEKYRKSYRECHMRRRIDRAQALGDQALAMCIDKVNLDENFESYLVKDSDLLVDLNMLLDDVHDYVSKKLKRKLSDVPKTTPSPNPDTIREERSTSVCENDPIKFQAAVALLGECSRNGFERLRKKICGRLIDQHFSVSFLLCLDKEQARDH